MLDKIDGRPTTGHSSPHVRWRQCRHGQMLYMPHDIFIGRSLDLYWEYSEIETKLFAQLLRPGHVVFEIGANIGCHTVPMARLIGDSGRVFAFEPQRIIHQMLCANIAQNGLFNVWAEREAVGNPGSGQWGFIGVPSVNYAQPGNFGGVALEPSTPEMVPLVCLDNFEPDPHFIKIDCEGMEIDVIAGAREKIRRCRPAIYVENDREEKSASLISAIMELDYNLYWHLPPLFNKDNLAGNPENVFGGIVSINMLCLPAEYKIKMDGVRKIESPISSWKEPNVSRVAN